MTRRRWMAVRITFTVVLIGLLVWRCERFQPRVVDAEDGPSIVVGRGHWFTTPGSEALLDGELAIVDGCLGISEGGLNTVVVWPNGTSLRSAEPLTVRVHGEDHRLGERIGVAGAGVEGTLADVFDDPPASCRDSADVFSAGATG